MTTILVQVCGRRRKNRNNDFDFPYMFNYKPAYRPVCTQVLGMDFVYDAKSTPIPLRTEILAPHHVTPLLRLALHRRMKAVSCGVALLCCVALLPLAISFCPSSLHAPGVLATGRYSNPLLKHRHREWARVSLVKNARCNTEGLRGAQSSTEWGQGAVKLAVGGMADLKNQVRNRSYHAPDPSSGPETENGAIRSSRMTSRPSSTLSCSWV